MSSRHFSSAAMRFWPTRCIAQKQASQLFDLMSGFVYSQILAATVKLDIAGFLQNGPASLSAISKHCKLDEKATHRLLKATTALKLTHDLTDSRYALGTLGIALVNNPGLIEMVTHHDMFYRDLTDPVGLLTKKTSTQLNQYWSYAQSDDPTQHYTAANHEVQAYSQLMAASQPMVAEQILQAYKFNTHRSVLDIGGGTGQFLKAVRHRDKTLKLSVFDLKSVNPESHTDSLQKEDINVYGGDFFNDQLPDGYDIMTLIRILHDHNDDAVTRLLSRVYKALPDNGTLLIAEPMSDTPGATRVGDAYFNFYFLAMGKGEPRNADKIGRMLQLAGFSEVQAHKTPLPLVCSVISAQKQSAQQV